MKTFSLILLSVLAVGACGGDDGGSGPGGLSGSKLVKDLTQAESDQLCAYGVQQFPSHSVTCDGQSEDEGLTSADCDEGATDVPATCTATVSDAEGCFSALGDLTDSEWCTLTAPPAPCTKLFSAECGSGDDGSGSAAPRTGEEMRARVAKFIR